MASSRTRKVLVLSSGSALSSVVALVSAGFLSRYFTPEEYGTYRQALLVYTFAAPFLLLGLPRALFRFLPGETVRPLGMILENIAVTIGLAGIFALLLVAGGNHLIAWLFDNPALVAMLLVVAPYSIAAGVNQTLGPCMTALERVGTVALFNIFSRLAQLTGIILGAVLMGSAFGALLGNMLAANVTGALAIYLMIRFSGGGDRRLTREGMRAQLKFAVPLGLSAVIGTVILNLDKFVVSALTTRGDFAIYVNGAIQVPLVGIVAASVTSVLLPEMVVNDKEGRRADSIPLWHLAFRRIGSALIPLAVFLFVFAPEVMRLLYGAQYVRSAEPFRVYLLMLFIIRPATLDALLMAADRSDYIFRRSVGSLVFNLALNLALVPLIGYMGAAIGTIISSHLWSLPYTLSKVSHLYEISVRDLFPTRTAVALIGAALIPAPLLWVERLLGLPDLVDLIVFGALYFPLVGLLYHRMGLLDAKALVRRIIRIIRPRKAG